MQTEFKYLPLNYLQAGQYQPRQDFNEESLQELSASIASQGLIEPIVVRCIAGNCYEILAGERRWRAAGLAGLAEVPCIIGNYSDQQACALTLIENIQRQDLNLIEEAMGYRRLIDEFNYHQDEISTLVGKSRSHIANLLRLLTLSTSTKDFIKAKKLSLGHARVLVGLSANQQELLAIQAIDGQWSVRQMELAVKQLKQDGLMLRPKNPKKDRDVERLQITLSEQLGSPVEIIEDQGEGGWLKVKFFDNDTLAGLFERLGLRYD